MLLNLNLIFSEHVSLQDDDESWAEGDMLAADVSSVDKPQGKMKKISFIVSSSLC